jgi:hypothetical protein
MDYLPSLCPAPPPTPQATLEPIVVAASLLPLVFVLGLVVGCRISKKVVTDGGCTADTQSNEHTLSGLLASTPSVSDALAEALLKGHPMTKASDASGLGVARSLSEAFCNNPDGGRDQLIQLLRSGDALEAVATSIWYAIKQLQMETASPDPAISPKSHLKPKVPSQPDDALLLDGEHEVAEAVKRAEQEAGRPLNGNELVRVIENAAQDLAGKRRK